MIDFEDIEIALDPSSPEDTWPIGTLEWGDWEDVCDLIAADLGRVVKFEVDAAVLRDAENAWRQAWSESYSVYTAATKAADEKWHPFRDQHKGVADLRETPECKAFVEAGRVAWDAHVERMKPINEAYLDAVNIPAFTWAHDVAEVGIETLLAVAGCMPFALDAESQSWLDIEASGEFCNHFVRVVAAAWKAGVL